VLAISETFLKASLKSQFKGIPFPKISQKMKKED
jgi:hypothetical protein